ncbi:hypothetical protein PMPD1_2942 [Paramixta manurensis]|uniref:DUF7480 domain-containing protein n=2 Tax=Paramixta manurensis TaxID=2740817 RepID=A0A6M8UAY3_9GAMM|nr:hypothetical protein PMPD1_2942 [Erwiniaceae bacterium PD-1]
MHKKFTIVAMAFLLSGCPGPMDRLPVDKPANVTMRDKQVCITVPTESGEYIASVEISDGENNNLDKTLNEKPITVSAGECLPVFNYDFKPDRTYTAHYAVAKSRTERSHYFSVEFTVNNNGIKQISPLADE